MTGGVELPVRDTELLTEELNPVEREAVALPLRVLLPLTVLLGVPEAVPVLLPVGLAVTLLLTELVAVGLPDRARLLL